MTFPITQISEPPSKSDPQSVFDIKTEALLESLIQTVETANDAFQSLSLDHKTTSTSTHAIGGDGLYVFEVGTGLGFVTGMYVTAAVTSAPQNNLSGSVQSYNSLTGDLVINVDAVNGAGTFSAWTLSVAIQNKENATFLAATTTGNSSAYLASFTPELTQIKDGTIIALKFHVACANNATVQLSGISPAMNLVFYDADDELVNVAAGDVKLNQTVMCMAIDNGARLLINPTSGAVVLGNITTPTATLTKSIMGTIQIAASNGGTVTFPPLADFKDGTGFSLYSTVAQVSFNAAGSDLISADGLDNLTSIGLRYLEVCDVIKDGGKWLVIRPYRKRKYTGLPAGRTMLLGDTLEYTLTGGASFPLNITTSDAGVYSLIFRETTRAVATSANPVTLSVVGLTANSITTRGLAAGPSGLAAAPATGSVFFLSLPTSGAVYMFNAVLDLTTSLKSCSSKSMSNSSSIINYGDVISISSDKTNPVSSIAAIACADGLHGVLTIERIA